MRDPTDTEVAGSTEQPPEPAKTKSILDELDWPKPRSKTEEFRQEFTKKIIGLMEQGEAFWQKPWKCPNGGLPYNAASGRRYNGVNVAYLMVSSDKNGFTDPRWMTYKQAQEAGYQVRGGEHGTKIEFYTEYDPSKTKKGAEVLDKKIQEMMDDGASQEEIEKAMKDQKTLIVKTYTVFNASQIEGIEPLQSNTSDSIDEFRHHERAESIMDNCGVPIRYGMGSAAYNKSQDIIKMPNREWFSTPEYFYSTVLHEIAHSTGHESRMNRDSLGKPFGSAEYAMEELRAEMASAFVFQEIGMPLSEADMEEHAKGHAAYTQNWLKSFQNDYKEFYKATRDAIKIADYTLAYDKTREKVNETTEIDENTQHTPTAGEARNTPDTTTPTSEAARTTTDDPVQAAKFLLGQTAIVTNAQKGRTYTGEILQVCAEYAVQKIGADRGIIHNLNKMPDPSEKGMLLMLLKDSRRVSISYDGEHRASVKTADREEERDSAVTR
jgi:antirestriction protein ArdC